MDDITQKGATDVVQTEYGPVIGGVDGGIRIFRGIPFAASTAGESRWKPAQPPKAWKEPRDATKFGPDSPQVYRIKPRSPGIDEDCLSVNVRTPAKDDKANLPVLVWLYGGSFVGGSGSAY